jgi:hypothetical protein
MRALINGVLHNWGNGEELGQNSQNMGSLSSESSVGCRESDVWGGRDY